MAMRALRYLGDPVLTTVAEPVTRFDKTLSLLVDDLMDSVDAPGRAGLAAPQIGVGLRVFSYLVDDRHGYVINPEIVQLSTSVQDGIEGCLSVPELWFPCHRANRAVVRGVNLRNEPVVVKGKGLMARCLQHETEHLDGILYLDRLTPELRREALRKARESTWFWGAAPKDAAAQR
ncbi:peptide deformylase [Solihabitans fulvus]|uniref:Peptide deformylase n=1 Tax=Solihabitans fulvus TaxID=1892852 RepID=A0A5B2WWJ9_9PSEU|nr:peptide deformylase [Solihabitans fulvus]KAA2254819.1 peptide deformylase [Solihabitans fulvus]